MRRLALVSIVGLLLSGGLTAYALNRTPPGEGLTQEALPDTYGSLPDSVRLALLNDRRTQATQVNRILGEINTAQMLGFMYGGWRQDFDALDLNPQADGYRFRMTQQAPGVVTWAEPTVPHYRPFVAAVAADGDRLREVRCVSLGNGSGPLPAPRLLDGQLQCPPGSQRLS
jgi:hypothetical protein